MAMTSVDLDPELIERARMLTGERSNRAVLDLALRRLIASKQKGSMIDGIVWARLAFRDAAITARLRRIERAPSDILLPVAAGSTINPATHARTRLLELDGSGRDYDVRRVDGHVRRASHRRNTYAENAIVCVMAAHNANDGVLGEQLLTWKASGPARPCHGRGL